MKSTEVTFIKVNDIFATVGAREDVDGGYPRVILSPNRKTLDDPRVILHMDPPTARAIGRRLKKWADLLDPPKPRRQ